MNDLSDTELVARVVTTKDTQAFEVLLRRHQSLIRNWLRQLSADFSSADDIAQETFILAWQKIHTYRSEGTFKNWLIKIAYTSFLQFKRKQKSQAKILEEVEVFGDRQTEYVETQALPDLQKLLSILTMEEKACMVLCYSHGYSHGEVSAMIDLPLGTVKSHIKRSTEKIRSTYNIEV